MSRMRGVLDGLPRITGLGVVVVLAIHAGILAWSATRHSPTWDEPGHLVAGLSHWKLGRFELYSVNPPLVRSVAAVPVLFQEPRLDWEDYQPDPQRRSEVQVGRKFVQLNGERSLDCFFVARWACIPFSLLGAFVCFRWSNAIYGPAAGFLALTLWCFSPLILGHGALITPDLPAAAMALAATYSFRAWLLSPTWMRAVGSGVWLGLSFLTKTTLLALFPLWCLIWLVWRWSDLRTDPKQTLKAAISSLSVMLVLGLTLLNGFYGFQGTGTALGDFKFTSDLLAGTMDARDPVDGLGNRFHSTWLGRLPLPFPKDCVLGMDIQRRDFERGYVEVAWRSYWHGRWQAGGWWDFYVSGLLVKEPVGVWLLLLLTLGGRRKLARRLPAVARRDEWMLLIPLLGLLWLVSSQTGLSRHLRYVLPAYAFLLVFVSQAARFLASQQQAQRDRPSGNLDHALAEDTTIRPVPDVSSKRTRGTLALQVAVVASCLWFIGSSVKCMPHSLSYFNELAGGPSRGSEWLVCSNFDWGQDLVALREWCQRHPEARPLQFAYFGPIDPQWLGIEYQLPAPMPKDVLQRPRAAQLSLGPQPGWYAISRTVLAGDLMPVPDAEGQFRYFGHPVFDYLKHREPVATAGHSIALYHLDRQQANDLRSQLGLPPLE